MRLDYGSFWARAGPESLSSCEAPSLLGLMRLLLEVLGQPVQRGEIFDFRYASLRVTEGQTHLVFHSAKSSTVGFDLFNFAIRRIRPRDLRAIPFPVFRLCRLRDDIVILVALRFGVSLKRKESSV